MRSSFSSSSLPEASISSGKKYEPNPAKKELYAALAKHSKLPLCLEITPKESVTLKSGKTYEICF